jgi:hypothetical protein
MNYNFELYSTQPLVAFVMIYTSPLEVVNSINLATISSNFRIMSLISGVRSRKLSALRKLVHSKVSSQSKINTKFKYNKLQCWYFFVGSGFIIPIVINLLIYLVRIYYPVLGVNIFKLTPSSEISSFFSKSSVFGRSILSLL